MLVIGQVKPEFWYMVHTCVKLGKLTMPFPWYFRHFLLQEETIKNWQICWLWATYWMYWQAQKPIGKLVDPPSFPTGGVYAPNQPTNALCQMENKSNWYRYKASDSKFTKFGFGLEVGFGVGIEIGIGQWEVRYTSYEYLLLLFFIHS